MLIRTVGATALLLSLVSVAKAQLTATIPVTDDTFIDSSATTSFANGYQTVSYGADGKVKVVSSATVNKNSGTQAISFTHTLFKIPQSLINLYSTGTVTDVTLNYYAVNDSLSNPSSANYDGDGFLQLHPLSTSFTIGNGQQTPAVASTNGGANWYSRDSVVDANDNYVNAWGTAGGDYDSTSVPDANFSTSNPLPAAASTSIATNVPFSFDITSLLSVDPTNSDLETFGGLIRLPNEPVSNFQMTNQTQDFVSLYSVNTTTTAFQPYFTVSYTPEPATLSMLLLAAPILLRRKR